MPDKAQRKAAKRKRQAPLRAADVLMQSPLRTPLCWAFRLYVSDSGRCDLQDWDQNLSAVARAQRAVAMKYLQVQPPQRWDRPKASYIGDHLYVIRFHDENRSQHRLFGFFDDNHHAFVICGAGFEVDNVYHPSDYGERTSSQRAEVCMDFGGRTIECDWPLG